MGSRKESELDTVVSSPESSDTEERHDYPTGWNLISVTSALCLAVFCVALDNTASRSFLSFLLFFSLSLSLSSSYPLIKLLSYS